MNIAQYLQYWRAPLEILLLWYLIYVALFFIKGTRTEQLLKGLVIIGIVYVLTQLLRLNAINWLITKLFPISVIALVIIFQPELRRGLTRLGQLGIHQEDIEMIGEVSKATVALSKKKVGALIVIEREVGLKPYIETGVAIDSKTSEEMIISIFVPHTPLHDGAVIIQNGRIAAAGCMLPLTQEEKGLPKSVGMRHKDAIGVSEETDSVSVVVSEETGSISIANGGKLIQGLDEENLVKSLKNIFYKPARKRVSFHIGRLPVMRPSGKKRD